MGPQKVIKIAEGIYLSQTVTTTWFIMACVIIFSFIVTRNLQKVPTKVQVFLEAFVTAIYGLVKQVMGEDKMGFAPYIGTLIVFIAVSNLSGLLGFRPPTADLNTTLALAILTFILVHGNGLRRKKFGYLKGFIEPNPFLLPLNIIGEMATPVSLSFRLFGNITGGMVIMGLLYQALAAINVGNVPLGLFIPIPAFLHIYFDVFSGVLQSFIFSMLTMVFVAMAMD